MSWLTPITNIGVSSFDGAESTTFLAPAVMCLRAVSSVKNKPVASTTTSAWMASHASAAGSRSAVTRIVLPLTISCPSWTSTVPLNWPCVESYFNIYAMYSASNKSLIPTTSISLRSHAARKTNLPIRPKPLIPILIVIYTSSKRVVSSNSN